MPQKNKQGDRQRTPRSPFGLPPKRPPQSPPKPSRARTAAMNWVDSLAALTRVRLMLVLGRSLPLMLPAALLLLKLRSPR